MFEFVIAICFDFTSNSFGKLFVFFNYIILKRLWFGQDLIELILLYVKKATEVCSLDSLSELSSFQEILPSDYLFDGFHWSKIFN